MKIKRQKGLENLAWALAALLILCSSLAAALPDLIVDSVSSPSVINTSANVTIEANISNIGDSSANNFMNLFCFFLCLSYYSVYLSNVTP